MSISDVDDSLKVKILLEWQREFEQTFKLHVFHPNFYDAEDFKPLLWMLKVDDKVHLQLCFTLCSFGDLGIVYSNATSLPNEGGYTTLIHGCKELSLILCEKP